jgi:peptidoglycan-associated lipoprotein
MTRSLIVPATLLILLAGGCAKRPATTAASGPAPKSSAGATGSRPQAAPAPAVASAGETSRGAGPAQTPAARPAPRDYVTNPALKDINFDFDKYAIRPADAKILDANAAWLKGNARQLLLIEGHCDARGTEEYNLALGERRAKAAMNYLVAQGIQAARISIVSYGGQRPLCREQNETCWARNRRARFLVKPE